MAAPVIEAKVVVIGSQGSGKTSLVLRHQHKESSLPKSIASTVGASFLTTIIKVENQLLRLQVWDTAGQERFRSMAPMYYRHANAALVVYDVTKEVTFREAAGWVHELKDNSTGDEVILCIIGNKVDLAGAAREVSEDDGREFAETVGASFFETSAVDSIGVEQAFTAVAKQIRLRHEVQEEARRQRERQGQAALLFQGGSEKRQSTYVLMNEDGSFQAPKAPSSTPCCGI